MCWSFLAWWALDVYETGNTRWRSIFAFASVGLVKGGYVTKSRGVWTITDEGRSVVSSPYDAPAFLAEVKKRYQAWKSNQLTVEADDASKSSMEDEDDSIPEPPELRMAAIQNQANEALSAELLETIKAAPPPAGEGPIRDFIGALVIKGVKKGVFLTTSYFTPAARAAVQGNKSDQKIVLIDGARLAALMIEHNLGVSTAQTFALKRLDTDFFTED